MAPLEPPAPGAPASPCINVCALDAQGYCIGCYRTIEEIAGWGRLGAGQQRAILRLLSERGYATVGLDFSLDAAGMAWKQNGVPAVCASLSKAPFAAGSCAAITMFHVLEHLYDPVSYIEAAHRLLRLMALCGSILSASS